MDLYADDPNYRAAVYEMIRSFKCWHCDARAQLRTASDGRRILDVHHEVGCPEHEDFGDDAG